MINNQRCSFKSTHCLQTVCKENQVDILRKLIEYLEGYNKPIFESHALLAAIEKIIKIVLMLY